METMNRRFFSETALCFLVFSLALILRFAFFSRGEIFLQEGMQFFKYYESEGFWGIWRQFSFKYPPLFHILQAATVGAKSSLAKLRFFPVIFGSLSVFFTYLLGRQFFTPKASFMAALIVAVNPTAVFSSQFAAMYSMSAALILATMTIVIRMGRKENREALKTDDRVRFLEHSLVIILSMALVLTHFRNAVPLFVIWIFHLTQNTSINIHSFRVRLLIYGMGAIAAVSLVLLVLTMHSKIVVALAMFLGGMAGLFALWPIAFNIPMFVLKNYFPWPLAVPLFIMLLLFWHVFVWGWRILKKKHGFTLIAAVLIVSICSLLTTAQNAEVRTPWVQSILALFLAGGIFEGRKGIRKKVLRTIDKKLWIVVPLLVAMNLPAYYQSRFFGSDDLKFIAKYAENMMEEGDTLVTIPLEKIEFGNEIAFYLLRHKDNIRLRKRLEFYEPTNEKHRNFSEKYIGKVPGRIVCIFEYKKERTLKEADIKKFALNRKVLKRQKFEYDISEKRTFEVIVYSKRLQES